MNGEERQIAALLRRPGTGDCEAEGERLPVVYAQPEPTAGNLGKPNRAVKRYRTIARAGLANLLNTAGEGPSPR